MPSERTCIIARVQVWCQGYLSCVDGKIFNQREVENNRKNISAFRHFARCTIGQHIPLPSSELVIAPHYKRFNLVLKLTDVVKADDGACELQHNHSFSFAAQQHVPLDSVASEKKQSNQTNVELSSDIILTRRGIELRNIVRTRENYGTNFRTSMLLLAKSPPHPPHTHTHTRTMKYRLVVCFTYSLSVRITSLRTVLRSPSMANGDIRRKSVIVLRKANRVPVRCDRGQGKTHESTVQSRSLSRIFITTNNNIKDLTVVIRTTLILVK
jgi:hypothetical protein